MTFDANTFGPDEVPAQKMEGKIRAGYSTSVLIDVDGLRGDLSYHIGWFDFGSRKWVFKDDSYYDLTIRKAKSIGMRWSFLPLAIYETNPELRKTVKI